jgi:hypothetical protein
MAPIRRSRRYRRLVFPRRCRHPFFDERHCSTVSSRLYPASIRTNAVVALYFAERAAHESNRSYSHCADLDCTRGLLWLGNSLNPRQSGRAGGGAPATIRLCRCESHCASHGATGCSARQPADCGSCEQPRDRSHTRSTDRVGVPEAGRSAARATFPLAGRRVLRTRRQVDRHQ